MAAALMPRELACWGMTAVALGALEGGLLGVSVKHLYAGTASPGLINLAVAIVAGAPAFTNLASYLFVDRAQGRDKLRIIKRLMLLMAGGLVLMALAPVSGAGLALFCAATVLARTAWTGILTLRAAVWRANYPRAWRARVTARIVQLTSLLVAATASAAGWLVEWEGSAFRVALLVAAGMALAAAWVYRGARLRRQRALLAAERNLAGGGGGRVNLRRMLQVLRGDDDFRHYMWGMMVFGGGNLMLIPMLVVMLAERTRVAESVQVLLTSALPLVVLCFAVPAWARRLDRLHIFAYRAVHSWFYVASGAAFALALGLAQPALLWPASVLLGLANAGGHLGWNLGHNDFSDDASAATYMAIHVSLTGLRGLVMPLLGVGVYQWLSLRHPALAGQALWLSVALSFAGALIFVGLAAARRRRAAAH